MLISQVFIVLDFVSGQKLMSVVSLFRSDFKQDVKQKAPAAPSLSISVFISINVNLLISVYLCSYLQAANVDQVSYVHPHLLVCLHMRHSISFIFSLYIFLGSPTIANSFGTQVRWFSEFDSHWVLYYLC